MNDMFEYSAEDLQDAHDEDWDCEPEEYDVRDCIDCERDTHYDDWHTRFVEIMWMGGMGF